MATKPTVLVIGLDPTRVPGPWDPAPIVTAIAAGLKEFEANGVAVETCLIPLDGTDDIDDIEHLVRTAVSKHPWQVITIGGGLRHSDDQVELLELVVNLIRRHAPDAAIAFNATADDTYNAAARWLT